MRIFALVLMCCASLARAEEPCQAITVSDPQPFIGNAGEVFVTINKAGQTKVWKVAKGEINYFYAYQPEAILCGDVLTLQRSEVSLVLIKE